MPRWSAVGFLLLGALAVRPAKPVHAQCMFRPDRACRVFGITEAGVALPLVSAQGSQDAQINLHLGLMRGRAERPALGGSVFLASGVDVGSAEFTNLRVGVAPRVRYWRGRRVAVDLLAGPTFSTGGDTVTTRGQIGFLGEASLNLGDWAAFSVQVERLPWGPTTWSLGARAGSYPGSVGIAAFILINLIDAFCSSTAGGCDLGY